MNDELDPRFLAALRDVPAVDDAVREAHIAAAVDAVVAARRGRTQVRSVWLVAAAAVLLLAGGVVLGRVSASEQPSEVAANAGESDLRVKGSVPTNPTSVAPCATDFPDHDFLKSYVTTQGTRLVFVRLGSRPRLTIVRSSDCAIVEEIDLP